jgi:hypothetical protein
MHGVLDELDSRVLRYNRHDGPDPTEPIRREVKSDCTPWTSQAIANIINYPAQLMHAHSCPLATRTLPPSIHTDTPSTYDYDSSAGLFDDSAKKDEMGRLTPARLTMYMTLPAMSSSFPARFAGTRSNSELNMFPASPTGFMLLGTTVALYQLGPLRCTSEEKLTTRIDSNYSYIEPAEFSRQ